MLDQLEQARIRTEQMLTDVRSRLDGVLLPFSIDDFAHPFDKNTFTIRRQKEVPGTSPDHLDDIPAGAAKYGLQFLNNVAVAAHRTVQSLQVAIDDEDQIVEFL